MLKQLTALSLLVLFSIDAADAQTGVAGVNCFIDGRYVYFEGRSTCPSDPGSSRQRRERPPREPTREELAWDAHHHGIQLNNQGRHREAEQFFREAIRLGPTFSNAYANLGASLLHQGRFAEAVDAYQMSLQYWSYCSNCIIGNTYYGLGYALWRLGRLDEAEQAFRNAGNHPDATRQLPMLLEQRRAESVLNSYNVLLEEGARLWRREDWRGAEAVYRKLVALHRDPALYSNLATTLEKQERHRESLEFRRKAYELDPTEQSRTDLVRAIRLTVFDGERDPVEMERLAREGLAFIEGANDVAAIAGRMSPLEVLRLRYAAPLSIALDKALELQSKALEEAKATNRAERSAVTASTDENASCQAGGPYDNNRCAPRSSQGDNSGSSGGSLSGATARLAAQLPPEARNDETIRRSLAWHQHLENIKADNAKQMAEVNRKITSGVGDREILDLQLATLTRNAENYESDQAQAKKHVDKRLEDLGLTWNESTR